MGLAQSDFGLHDLRLQHEKLSITRPKGYKNGIPLSRISRGGFELLIDGNGNCK